MESRFRTDELLFAALAQSTTTKQETFVVDTLLLCSRSIKSLNLGRNGIIFGHWIQEEDRIAVYDLLTSTIL